MRIPRVGIVAGVLLLAQLAGTSCILIPKIVDRSVRMVVAQVASVPLHATGATNTIAGANVINLRDSVNIAQAVRSAGIQIDSVSSIVVSKVEYKVLSPDATPGRQITNGHIQVSAAGGAYTDLIVSFSHGAGAVTPWTRAPLTAAGVTQLNQMLASILAELKGGPTADEHIGYTITGTSAPTTTPTDFWYAIRVTFEVSGRLKTKVLD